ncbi:BTB/POZ domain-containing protein [Acorus gramineus]|uniref:BTB/POZ domain-containing protein n=1 Tax=Acorus gramineus TaxID=55184 RepID=A0AAV9A1B9_ACOGR|nr:BTB/POZ domain-containing protein [Acorus gramineus]
MLVALEGILHSRNENILRTAADVTVKLFYFLGDSIAQYRTSDLILALSLLLSLQEKKIAVSCAAALTCIIKKVHVPDADKESWKILEETDAVNTIINAIQDYISGIQTLECFLEMASLLKIVLQRFPYSRYHVWSNTKLIDDLQDLCIKADPSIAIAVLQLCSALALCGDGAIKLLENGEHLLSLIVCCIENSQPRRVRIEAFILCQHIMRSERLFSVLVKFQFLPIVQGIIGAMGGWRSSSCQKVPADQVPLVVEACRTALITRWAGEHHSYFWKSSIDRILLDLLVGNRSKISRHAVPLPPKELMDVIYDDVSIIRPYIWDILGWLATHCDETFHPIVNGEENCLDILISCACFVAVESMCEGCYSSLSSSHTSQLEPLARAVLLMMTSPSKYISLKARHHLSEALRPLGYRPLENLLDVLKSTFLGNAYLEGGDIVLYYSLQALFCLISLSDLNRSEVQDMIKNLQELNSDSFSPRLRLYSAYNLNFFGFYGYPTKLGKRMEKAISEYELADMQLLLSDGQSIDVHSIILMSRCPSLLPPGLLCCKGNPSTVDQNLVQKYEMPRHRVRLSDRIDNTALRKLLEYVYTGCFQVDEDLLSPLKILSKHCGLKLLSHMLHRKHPILSSGIPTIDFTAALEPAGLPFSDIILEANATRGGYQNCSNCSLSTFHVHAHRIILWANCDYFRALFQSGMQDSSSRIIKVSICWEALVKLVRWFYSGTLPRLEPRCQWKNMDTDQQQHDLQTYVELSWIAELWFIDEVRQVSMDVILSCLKSKPNLSLNLMKFAATISQWDVVQAAATHLVPLYPQMRDAGDLEQLDDVLIDILRTGYMLCSQGASN